jgi:hypothetical protein
MAPAQRVASLFSAVTSAMQPARFPLALLAVLFISALAPLVDLAGGSNFGPRGFSAGALTESEQALDEQRARSAARRFAGPCPTEHPERQILNREIRTAQVGGRHPGAQRRVVGWIDRHAGSLACEAERRSRWRAPELRTSRGRAIRRPVR